MAQFTNLLVVYDPTQEGQPALERAAEIVDQHSAKLHVFACIHSDLEGTGDQSDAVKRLIDQQQDILDKATAFLVERGVELSTEVEWDRDWYHAVVRASVKNGSDMVLKSSYKHSAGKRMLSKTSDWTLIRECLCPVLLVKEAAQRDVLKVLAAVDITAKKESYSRLNQNILNFSKQILDTRGSNAEVHVINAFQDVRAFPDREELVRDSGVESDNIHIRLGNPEDVIVDQARSLDVSLVVLGNSTRSGLAAALLGNTVEKVLDKLDCDVLSMP
ncbi:MAG: universal stress protein [Halieaceae bacterium]|jgi:universal stress protein E|nr:universal stress protein [Halieaceae bacterium]